MINTAVLILAAYLWGSLSPANFVARWRRGIDLLRYGSGNLGASNIGEQLGLPWKIAVGAADVFKGWAPATLVWLLGYEMTLVVWVGLATIVGHIWSIWLGFRGGRGLATTLGVLCLWDIRLVVFVLLLLLLGEVTRLSGLVSLLALALLTPVAALLGDPFPVVIGAAAIVLLIVLKRLEANRLPLPADPGEKRAVFWRRLWFDRDVPAGQAWEHRQRFT